MSEALGYLLALAVGLALGVLFFGGLWITVNKGMKSARPALWFFGSLILRTTVAIGGFFLVCRDDWARWIICLIGFTAARFAVKWWTETRDAEAARMERELPHAP